MEYSSFRLSNYRCFKTEQVLDIAMPDHERMGSGLTYVVGGNNVGKTTLLEAMQFQENDVLRSSEYVHNNIQAHFIYKNAAGADCRTLTNRVNHYLLFSPDNSAGQDSLPYFVPSRRYWQTRVQSSNTDEQWLLSSSQRNRLRMASDNYTDMDMASLLKRIESDKARYNELVAAMRSMIPDFTGYAVAAEDYEYIEYTSGNDRYKSSFSGDGISSLLRIVANIISADSHPIVIDEPELSLHPTAKRKLASYLGECSKNKQIILATHDPYFVSWDYIRNGAKVNKLVKDTNNNTVIHHLDNFSKYEGLIRSGENWQKPQMMDLLSKEIFFSDNVIFLEGQDDVGLFRKEHIISNDLINVFGYGIGGFGFANAALNLASDLGVKRAAIILDDGENERATAASLRNEFGQYKVIKWNKGDIRDKYKDGELLKEGYFDQHGNLKPESELDDFYEKIADLKAYFEQ